MNPGWNLKQVVNPLNYVFTLEHVLVWHDEPQVITVLDSKRRRHIAVATDDSDTFDIVRWVYVPISNLETRALACGAATVRDAIDTDNAMVIDRLVDGGEFRNAWLAQGTDIPDDVKPSFDSFLPNSAKQKLGAVAREGHEITIDGGPIHGSMISFTDLGSVVMSVKPKHRHIEPPDLKAHFEPAPERTPRSLV